MIRYLTMVPISPYQFSFYRIFYSLFSFFYFIYLIFQAKGFFDFFSKNLSLNSTKNFFSNIDILNLFNSYQYLQVFLFLLALLSFLICLGIRPIYIVLPLWLGWIYLMIVGRPFVSCYHFPVSLILLFFIFIPLGEPLKIGQQQNSWKFSYDRYEWIWKITGILYFIHALFLVILFLRQEGEALRGLLTYPLIKSLFPSLLSQKAPLFLYWNFYFFWGLQFLFLPLLFFQRARIWIWNLWLMNLLIQCWFGSDPFVSLGLILFHFFLFDRRWLCPQIKQQIENPPIVFFDGVCILCNRFVDFLLLEDSERILKFAPLQGSTAQRLALSTDPSDLKTIILLENNTVKTQSEAVFSILILIGGIWRPLGLAFRYLPLKITNVIYNFVSLRRYRIFGKREFCRRPTQEEKSIFLD